MTAKTTIQVYIGILSALFVLSIPFAFIAPDLANVRKWQIVLNALFIVLLILKRKRIFTGEAGNQRISRPLLGVLAAASLAAFLFCGVSHYLGFRLNGIDFSIFDWMLYNTNHRALMTSPACGGANHFGIHQTWVMLPLVPLHRLFQTPYLLIVTHAVVLWSAILPLWKLSCRYLKSEALGVLVVAAYLTNAWTGRILNYGFHNEVFFVPAGLFFVWGWVSERPRTWVPALLVFLSAKEDAAIYIIFFAAGVLLFERKSARKALAVLAVSAALLIVNLGVIQPHILHQAEQAKPGYLHFWGDYGGSTGEIVKNMLLAPGTVGRRILTSKWYQLFGVFLFLPLLSRRPLLVMLPVVGILGSTSYEVMRAYGVYYAAPLLPFLFWGLLEAYENLPRLRISGAARNVLFSCILLFAPLFYSGYMKQIEFRFPVLRDVEAVRQSYRGTTTPVCAQASLFPHLPYQWDLRLLSEENLSLTDAIGVVHPALDPYPGDREGIESFIEGGSVLARYPSGLVVFRAKEE
jgi:uncharacterized membrane protein